MRRTLLATLLLVSVSAPALAEGTLRIGLQEDPDVLDPHRARTFVGRMIFTSLCDKLVDVAPDLTIVPQLATEWSFDEAGTRLTFKLRPDATFQDGTKLDAAAVKANIERAKSLPDSLRKSELTSVASVEAPDAQTVVMNLSKPDATLLAQLSDRAGMILAPSAFETFADKPVCSGPYSFVSRTQNDRIVLRKNPAHYDAANYHFDELVFLPIPDTTVRLANLQSGDIDMLERLAPNDIAAVEGDPNLRFLQAAGTGFVEFRFNVANGERAKEPFGSDKRIRQAFQLSIDRNVINEVVGFGTFEPAQQPFPPASPYYNQSIPVVQRDVERAKALLKEAGHERVSVEMAFGNSTTSQQIAELVQAMAAEAGFDVTLRPTEFAAMQQEMQSGNFQMAQIGWSGRVDPDGNVHQFMTCKGSLNDGKYCNPEVDRLLNEARTVTDQTARKALYDQVQAITQDEMPSMDIYYQPRAFALRASLDGFTAHPDGMIRLRGVMLKP
ncbi:ABC transporter substrate-binding protein [Aureimonas sp. AU4]|uniref:ABC transporter substrate-binding protein n=1 Tax=Aureimonas sp. AU4 TaxID=1638163 RepID=UPI0007060024|nr:ABC transporter substrate-binding protein [Aureimonas sp. AU4]BAT30389.1 putative glutathione transporter, solute-binding component [Aureimonas sp. AU4]